MKKIVLTLSMMFFVVAWAMADITATGNVIDKETNEPLIGANVLVKGSTIGTITDFDGNFELVVPDKAVLEISYVGYKTVEQTAGQNMKLMLESDATMLGEVVSLGYSAVKKAELSSAVVTIDGEKLNDVTTPDVGNMLQGKIAGVQVTNASGQPGEAAQIRIRGTGSITASSDPVYVVDGIMGGSFNPNDVESISVLKDAGSTGIYGAAAAGGVIVVTTKQGKYNSRPVVELKVNAGAKQANMGNYKMMNSEELYNFHKSLYSKTLFNTLRPKELLSRDYNWQKEFFKTGIVQNYNASIKGGGEKVNYYAALDYYDEKGTLVGTGTQRFNGRANMSAKITNWLDIQIRSNFTKQSTTYESSWTMLDDAFQKMPWDNPYAYDEKGNQTDKYVYIAGDTRSDNGKPWYSQTKWNSLHSTQYNYSKGDDFSSVTDLQINLHFTDWLHFTSTNTYSHGDYKSTYYVDPRAYDSSYGNGYLENSIGISNSFGTTNILKGGYQWGQHFFNAMAGFEYGTWNTEYTSAAGIGMPDGVDALNATTAQSVGGYKMPGASWATFLQASYDYAKRYFITATFRAEASSIFAPANRVGYFPSVAASWLISNENWMKNQKVVSFLKLRASYGVTGNNNIPAYKYLSTYALTIQYQDKTAATPSRLANPLLHWETANMAAVGVDLAFIDRIDMSFDFYNTDNTGLLLNVPVAPSTGFFEVTKNAGSVNNKGFEYRIDANVIKIGKWNWDLGFNIGVNKNKVTSTPNGAFLQTASSVNQQVKEGQDMYTWYMREWAGVDPKNGDPLWYVVDADGNYRDAVDAEGKPAGNVTDKNGAAKTNTYNNTNPHAVGSASPKFSGGLNTQVSWNGIYLNINTCFQYGNLIYNYTRQQTDADGAYIGYNQLSIKNSVQGWKRWEKAGDVATHPKAVLNGNQNSNGISSRYLEDGSYFRLRNVTLGYDFRPQELKKMHLQKLRIYFTADNLFTATKFSGMDPEISLTTTTYNLAGMYTNIYPVGMTMVGGLEISF